MLLVIHTRPLHSEDSAGVARIAVDQLKIMLGKPDTVVIDVRKPRSWWRSSKKISTAVREEPSNLDKWQDKYSRNQTLVFY